MNGWLKSAQRIPTLCVMAVIVLYRLTLSPLLGPAKCRFEPSCSCYALDAVAHFGVIRGVVLTVRRLSRCHPWGGSGYDPVPISGQEQDKKTGSRQG